MYDKQTIENVRKTSPDCFEFAEHMYGALDRGTLLVRAFVKRYSQNRLLEFSLIEIIDLEKCHRKEGGEEYDYDILFRLKFTMEWNIQANEITLLDPAIYVDGPTWEGVPLGKGDILNQFAVYIHEWRENKELIQNKWSVFNPWIDSYGRPFFVGYLALSEGLRTCVPAHHPLMLPTIATCFGSFSGNFNERLDAITRGHGLVATVAARRHAMCSFLRRFGSFVAQAKRENTRGCLGSLFAS